DGSPLWSAQVKVTTEPLGRDARPVFLPHRPRDVMPGAPVKWVHFPGTMRVHVNIGSVCLNLGNAKMSAFNATHSTDATFLVSADRQDWQRRGNGFVVDEVSCIAGQLPLMPFFGPSLEQLPQQFVEVLKGVFPQRIANLWASSSGFIFDGKVKM